MLEDGQQFSQSVCSEEVGVRQGLEVALCRVEEGEGGGLEPAGRGRE